MTPGDKPVMVDETEVSDCPVTVVDTAVELFDKSADLLYKNRVVVLSWAALTVAFNVAPEVVTAVAAAIVAEGATFVTVKLRVTVLADA